jgi:hypothetical protein
VEKSTLFHPLFQMPRSRSRASGRRSRAAKRGRGSKRSGARRSFHSKTRSGIYKGVAEIGGLLEKQQRDNVRSILIAHSDTIDVNALHKWKVKTSSLQSKALGLAAMLGLKEVVGVLLGRGASATDVDGYGHSALYWALSYYQHDIASYLIEGDHYNKNDVFLAASHGTISHMMSLLWKNKDTNIDDDPLNGPLLMEKLSKIESEGDIKARLILDTLKAKKHYTWLPPPSIR